MQEAFTIAITVPDTGRKLYLKPSGHSWTDSPKHAGRWARAVAFAKGMTIDAAHAFPPEFRGGPELVPVV